MLVLLKWLHSVSYTQCFIYAVTIIDREERLDSHVAVVILNRPKYILTYRILFFSEGVTVTQMVNRVPPLFFFLSKELASQRFLNFCCVTYNRE